MNAYDKLKTIFNSLEDGEALYFTYGLGHKRIERKIIGFKYEGVITENNILQKKLFEFAVNPSYKIVKVVDKGEL